MHAFRFLLLFGQSAEPVNADNSIPGVIGGALMHLFMRLFGHTGVTGWNWRSFGVAVLGAVVLLFILRLVRGGGRARGRA